MVPGDREGGARRHHVHGEAQDAGDVGAPVHEVAQKHGLAASRMAGSQTSRLTLGRAERVAEAVEQSAQLIEAAVDVADHVERTAISAQVAPERLALDDGGVDLLRRSEHVDVPEALALQAAQALAELLPLLPDDVRAKGAIRTSPVALPADLLWQVQDEGDRQRVELASELHERLAGLRLDVGGVHHGEPAGGEPLRRDEA